MNLSPRFSRRNSLTSLAVTAGSTLLSKNLLATPPQDPVVNTIQKDGKAVTHEKVSWRVLPFPMKQVRLGEGPCKIAMEADRQYLHSLPPDRALASAPEFPIGREAAA
jgi:hypothetical protein